MRGVFHMLVAPQGDRAIGRFAQQGLCILSPAARLQREPQREMLATVSG